MIIDLSQPITEDTPVYPGDPSVQIKQAGELTKDGFCDHVVTMGTHVGTHIDAPMHMLEGGTPLADISPERFVARGVCVDVRGSFDGLYAADIREGDIVLLYYGYGDKYHTAEYFENFPSLTTEAAEYLLEKKINMVASDTCSPDGLDGFPIHRLLLGAGILIIENLTNLDMLVGKTCTIYALPIALQKDAAPARVIAQTTE